MNRELAELEKYFTLSSNEDAKRKHAYAYFTKLFGKDFKTESDASGADGYIEGKLLIELKSKSEDWLCGLYQGLHYRKLGLTFPHITVLSKQFICLWNLIKLPKECLRLADEADSQISPSEMGRINANKTKNVDRIEILRSHSYLLEKRDLGGLFAKDIDVELRAYTHALKYLDDARIQINLRNFIDYIERFKLFFGKPMDAVHAFYSIVGYWGDTSLAIHIGESEKVSVVDPSRGVSSEPIEVEARHFEGFKKFVENHYIFTNEGSGITYDNYFSRFDEVISRIDPEYAQQHGIFFTDHNLSKFAMWFVHEKFEKNLSDNYIVFDPAGGSGNLITSLDWRGNMKHKIVSELQPDLLKVIERRMRVHERHIGNYTVIPKTAGNKGLNFLDRSGELYLAELENVLREKNMRIDKPLAFLMNPPYKSTDENVASREQVEAEYTIDPSILEVTGNDAGRERYLAFLGQILNIAKNQYEKHGFEPILMVFTPTSWLIPRTTFQKYREEFDKYFRYVNGFIINSKEFFALEGKWPLAFTIWQFSQNENGHNNSTRVVDLTHLKCADLSAINWSARLAQIDFVIKQFMNSAKSVRFDNSKKPFRNYLPKVKDYQSKKQILKIQPRYNFYRNRTREERDVPIVSGFPFLDQRHIDRNVPYGFADGKFLGFMDDLTPVRLYLDAYQRISDQSDRVWFRLDLSFIDINKSKLLNGPPDQKGYCAYDLKSALIAFQWFAISKCLVGRYPMWANQFDLWKPRIKKGQEVNFNSLCFAYGLAENRCVVTKFEANNPVEGAPEVIIENPLSTNNRHGFWNTVLDAEIVAKPTKAKELVDAIKALYLCWAKDHCVTGIMTNVGLKEEPYFKHFAYDDFLTPNSGLIQIKKYADQQYKTDLIRHFDNISAKTKAVKDEIYRLLVEEFRYFD